MTTDFRALCAELVESVEVLLALRPAEARPLRTTEDRLSRARAALADGPAVPQGREPAAVTGQPSDEELRELYQGPGTVSPIEYAHDLLARRDNPTPQPPDDGEVAELVAWLRETGDTIQPSHLAEHQRYKRAAELLQRQVLVPVAVSERLPGQEDCDAKWRCWWHRYTPTPEWHLRFGRTGQHNHWLPAHALPLPGVGE